MMIIIQWMVSTSSSSSSASKPFFSTPSSNYINIMRTPLVASPGEVVTLSPQGWLSRALRSFENNNTNKIREVIYIPSQITLLPFDGPNSCDDDDHFCSILCERGYQVHTLSMNSYSHDHQVKGITEVLNWRKKTTPPRTIAIIAHELSCITVLKYLAEIALPMTADRVDIGLIVLLDPPPLSKLYTIIGKEELMQRYLSSYNSLIEFKSNINVNYKNDINGIEQLYRSYCKHIISTPDLLHMLRLLQEEGKKKATCLTTIEINNEKEEDTGVDTIQLEIDLMMQEMFSKSGVTSSLKSSSRKQRGRSMNNAIYPRSVSLASQSINPYNTDVLPTTVIACLNRLFGSSLLTNTIGVRDALLNRILVLDTGRLPGQIEFDVYDKSSLENEIERDSLDDWGPRAITEVAELYGAGPVVSLRHDDEDDNDDDDEDDSDKKILFKRISASETCLEDEDASGNTAMQQLIISPHHRIARKISDWFILVSRFAYL